MAFVALEYRFGRPELRGNPMLHQQPRLHGFATRRVDRLLQKEIFTPALTRLGLAIGVSVAAAKAATVWWSLLLRDEAPRLAAIAGLGAGFFAICQAMLRFNAGRIRLPVSDSRIIVFSFAIAALGFALAAADAGFAASLAGFALIGFGTGAIVPCSFALAARRSPGRLAGGSRRRESSGADDEDWLEINRARRSFFADIDPLLTRECAAGPTTPLIVLPDGPPLAVLQLVAPIATRSDNHRPASAKIDTRVQAAVLTRDNLLALRHCHSPLMPMELLLIVCP